jgi:serine/threonine protein phosphatase PrpC
LIAVATFLKTMNEYCVNFADDFESLLTFLNREGDTKVAQTIETGWKRRILKKYNDEIHDGPFDVDDIYRQYGCTLLGLLVTPAFFFAFQIGDGDIVFLDDAGCEHVISRERMLGTQTDSLCQRNAWKKAISVTKRRGIDDGIPYAFMLSTDGFVNSYDSIEEYKKSCVGYYSMIKEYGAVEVAKNLKKWLEETSEMGCGDDVSAVFFYAIDSGEQDDVKR